jgi:hypothetical protein
MVWNRFLNSLKNDVNDEPTPMAPHKNAAPIDWGGVAIVAKHLL